MSDITGHPEPRQGAEILLGTLSFRIRILSVTHIGCTTTHPRELKATEAAAAHGTGQLRWGSQGRAWIAPVTVTPTDSTWTLTWDGSPRPLDARQEWRVPLPMQGTYQLDDGIVIPTVTQDWSASGIRFRVPSALPAGTRITWRSPWPDTGAPGFQGVAVVYRSDRDMCAALWVDLPEAVRARFARLR